MNRLFLDANVLFSAALTTDGVASALIAVSLKREDIILLMTHYALNEAQRNLDRKAPNKLIELEALRRHLTLVAEPPKSLKAALASRVPDPDDVPILAGAVAAKAHFLVTGNRKHFGKLYGTTVKGVLVLAPREMLTLLLP